MSDAIIIACVDLAGRAGAANWELAWTCPHVPDEGDNHNCAGVTWSAQVQYRGARLMSGEQPSPAAAALDLAERMLIGAVCRCRKQVTLADDHPGCRWRLVGQRWEPGCDAPTIQMPAGSRGDHAAMERALRGRR